VSVEVRELVPVGTRTRAAPAMAAFARDVLGLVRRREATGEGAASFDLPDGSSFAVWSSSAEPPRSCVPGGRPRPPTAREAAVAPGRSHRDAPAPARTKAVAMGLRTAVTALVQQRRRGRAAAAASEHETARAVRGRTAPAVRDVAVGGQTGSTVA
jgi:hypothetical protein